MPKYDIIYLRQKSVGIDWQRLALQRLAQSIARRESLCVLVGYLLFKPTISKDGLTANFNLLADVQNKSGFYVTCHASLVESLESGDWLMVIGRLRSVHHPRPGRSFVLCLADLVIDLVKEDSEN